MQTDPTPNAKENRHIVAVRLPPDLLRQLDAFCATQQFSPSRTRVVEAALRRFLESEEQPARKSA